MDIKTKLGKGEKMGCENLRYYRGTKSQVIQQMIEDKVKARLYGLIPKIQTAPLFVELNAKYMALRKDILEVEDEIGKYLSKNDFELKNKTEFADMDKRKKILIIDLPYGKCNVPKCVVNRLSKADALQALGKFREAKKIWDDVINEYGLTD